MALDGIYLSLLKKELEPLIDSRVDRIHQPSREELVIGMRTRGGMKRVLFSANAGSARVHITQKEIENPQTPPMFCMLLRKHLSSGRLIDIRQDGLERILYFDFEATDEMGDRVMLTLAAEIMGRFSNIILFNSDGKIIDSIKRVGQDCSSVRTVLPGMIYETPPRGDRLDLFNCSRQELEQRLAQQHGELSKALLGVFEGVSPIFTRECAFFALRGAECAAQELDGEAKDRLWFFLDRIREQIKSGKNEYTVVKTKEGSLKDFCFCAVHQYGGLMVTKSFETAGELLDHFYSERDAFSRTKQKASDLFKLLVTASERTRRRVENQRQELLECAERDKYRVYGDLIMANLYVLSKGMSVCRLVDLYDEQLKEVEIPLDKRLTPTENAQRFYKEYRKLDTAEKKLTQLIRQGEEEFVYLDSVLDALTRASTEAEIAELREELVRQGYAKRRDTKAKPPKALPPLRFVTPEGFVIRVGRNNTQNDRLTCKESEKEDMWLHTKDITGSHVIISAQGKEIPDSVILTAARLAACYSKGRESSQVGVDYTLVKYVKKPNGAKPGMVIFTNNRTLYVTPFSSEEAQELSDPRDKR